MSKIFTKQKIKILSLAVIFLLVGSSVSAIYNFTGVYERTPSNFSIISPVSFHIATSSFNGICYNPPHNYSKWRLHIWDLAWENLYTSAEFSSTTLDVEFEMSLPTGEYVMITPACFNTATETYDEDAGLLEPFEYIDWDIPVFEIIDPVIPILTISEANISTLLAHIGTLVSDVSIVIMFAIGLPLGFWVIRKTISLFKKR